jgi:hypothetical protein
MTNLIRAAAFAGALLAAVTTVHAQSGVPGGKTSGGDVLLAQAPTAAQVAMQAAIDAKDVSGAFAILNSTPRDQRGALATMLLTAAQTNGDKQFAASLAALAFLSGGLTTAQQNTAVAIVRSAPGGLAIVASLVSSSGTTTFGSTSILSNLVITENKNISSNTQVQNGSQN